MRSDRYDQAESLRQKSRNQKKSTKEKGHADLPSRKETHSGKRKKMKWKLRFPTARLLLILFLMIVVLAVLAPLWLDL